MKFVKRISLFFIYPMTMYGLGFASHMGIQEFFYPGDPAQQKEPQPSAEQLQEEEAWPLREEQLWEEEALQETLSNREPVLTANTSYIVISYDTVSGASTSREENAPDAYIGYTREQLQNALAEYGKSPSLTDQEKGFEGAELMSFSPQRVVVRKSYGRQEEGFFLVNEDHQVVVYDKTLDHVYMNTGIRMEELPVSLQEEIHYMKYVETEEELYHFLESYSS